MRFSTTWNDDAPNAAAEEAATLCDLQIWIGEINVTKHLDEALDLVESHVSMPAYSLAMGLAADWWKLFGGRRQDYRLIRHRMGYAIPDVRLRFDGLTFEAWTEQKLYENPQLRFWVGPAEVMSRESAERALCDFISAVADRLTAKELRDTGLQQQWEQVQKSRHDSDEAIFCEAAGALGKNPYSISGADANLIEEASVLFQGEPLLEFLAGIGTNDVAVPAMEWIQNVEDHKGYRQSLPLLGSIAKQSAEIAPYREDQQSWSLGYRRARALRRTLGIDQSVRFSTVSPLAKRMGSNSFAFAPWVEGIHAMVTKEDTDETHIFLRDRPVTKAARRSHLFSFARAIGDAICFPQTRRAVVNDLHDAARQAAGRAFAAEFLAPIDEILSMRESGKDNESIAEHLSVSTAVVERQFENRQRIMEACN